MVRRETPVTYAEIRRLKPLPMVKWWVYKCPLVLIQLRPAGSEADSRDTVERMADQLQVGPNVSKSDSTVLDDFWADFCPGVRGEEPAVGTLGKMKSTELI